MKTVFLRVLEASDKATALLTAVRESERALGRQRFEVSVSSFADVPQAPFAYWVSEELRRLFRELPPFESEDRTAKQGLATSDDFRFVRAWWAVSPIDTAGRWRHFTKGGSRASFYNDISLCVAWDQCGKEIKAFAETTPGTNHWSRRIAAVDWYFRPGFSWALRTARFSPSCVPADCIFSVSRYQAFLEKPLLLAAVGLLNGAVCTALLRMCLENFERPKFIIGIVQTLPFPTLGPMECDAFTHAAHRAWSLKRMLSTRTELSHAFTLPALLQVKGDTLVERADAWADCLHEKEVELAEIQVEIDELCFKVYGISDADRRDIVDGFGTSGTESLPTSDSVEPENDAGDDGEAEPTAADAAGLAAELVSWAAGVAFGRFDVRLATSGRPLPSEPEPFDPLPACSPGMLTGTDGLPLGRPPAGYPLSFPEAGVLVDDPGDRRDLTAAVRAVFDVVFGAAADRWWNDVAALLDSRSHDLHVWLADGFFEHHLKHHSKSRRKAPILWQIGTPSGRYSVWLYAHRLTRDSFFQLQSEVVGPKVVHEERQLMNLTQSAGVSPSASERKEIAAQEAFVDELRAMLDEIKRVASLWNPDQDDGVMLTMAPLWRLVPQHKPWQKELRAKWDELAAGKHDWSHLAMHLWPERVAPKCRTDRSLAIAHGLEDVFWVESADGKWSARATPTRPVGEIVQERSSTAVKAALKSLLDAPTASGIGRIRGRRAASQAANEVGSR